ncbi:MAG: LON peptidase substrate-binding domain-containing protein [Chloroflexi bacterium]|nr:LON peptidase substrate-binding domain-containing protein [Chloroflexota bacterium]
MYRLPLFPLNTVLFPRMPINLHIFEERYKQMIRHCIEKNLPFGVVLLESGSEVQEIGGPAVPFSVGCSAQITHVQHLAMGRMNITAVGHERFQVQHFETEKQYLVGVVENLSLRISDAWSIAATGRRLRVWVEKYLALMERAETIQVERYQLPADDIDLTYLAASILKIPMSDKQKLLSEDDLAQLMDRLRELLRKEATILDVLVAASGQDEPLPFSHN